MAKWPSTSAIDSRHHYVEHTILGLPIPLCKSDYHKYSYFNRMIVDSTSQNQNFDLRTKVCLRVILKFSKDLTQELF